MQIYLIPMHKFVGINNLKEVSDPVIFEKGNIPSPNGLLSTDIFGTTAKERQNTFAYINLNGAYLAPFVFKMLRRMNRDFEHMIQGTKRFVINDQGQLVQDEEKGHTGIEYLYKNWEKLKFDRNSSSIRGERIDLLTAHGKEVLFVKFWDVIPAYLRDVNLQSTSQGKVSHHEINDLYSRLIRLCSTVKNGSLFDFTLTSTQYRIQTTLVEIYDLIKSKLEKKNGLIRKSLLGKSIDYGSRSVISAPIFDSNDPEGMEVDFYHAGVPLAQCCALFTPFITSWVRNWLRRELEMVGAKFPIYGKDGEVDFYLELEDPSVAFSEEIIKKAIDRFVHAPADRFEKIYLPTKPHPKLPKGKRIALTISGRNSDGGAIEDKSPLVERPITWTDLFYQAAIDVTGDKMIWVTRYPLLDYFGMFPIKVRVLTTIKTKPMYVQDRVYEKYPVVDFDIPKSELSVYFIDTLRVSNLYLAGLDGDYDGDQVTIKAVFTQEACQEAEQIMRSKTHILNVYGSNMRKTTNEGVQTLYTLTK